MNVDGRPDALYAAATLSAALDNDEASARLSPPMRDAILRVIDDARASIFEPLRTALASDQRARR